MADNNLGSQVSAEAELNQGDVDVLNPLAAVSIMKSKTTIAQPNTGKILTKSSESQL
jgi:hypothetical protein